LRILRDALFFFILVDFRKAKIKKRFRALRSAASLRGWIAPVLRPGPVFRQRAGCPSPLK